MKDTKSNYGIQVLYRAKKTERSTKRSVCMMSSLKNGRLLNNELFSGLANFNKV